MADSHLIVACALAGAMLGCQAHPETPARPPPESAPPPAPPGESVGISDRDWDSVFSARYSLSLSLPERKTWQVDDARAQWFTARHSASRAELMLKAWRAPRLVTIAECRNQVRLWQPKSPDPEAAPETVVEKRPLEAPTGYETELVVGVRRTETPGEIEGFAVAVGRALGQCYAAIYTTHASGRGAEQVVGDRLALAADAILPRVEKHGVEDRVR